MRTSLLVFILLFYSSAIAASKKEVHPYPLYPGHYEAVKYALEGNGDSKAAIKAINHDLEPVVIAMKDVQQVEKLKQLLCLRAAAQVFSKAKDREIPLYLLENPRMCGRFLHALDEKDDLDASLKILKQLKDFDLKRFEKTYEFCIAYSVVWDKFKGHHWVDRRDKKEEGVMLATYEFYTDHEKWLMYKPSQLPFELAVYVVGTRLRASEREWIKNNYSKMKFNARSIYSSVPWTKVLSPAHGTGGDMEYTLENIKKSRRGLHGAGILY